MKVLILGFDGYIGWPLSLHLLKLGHRVYGADNGFRRKRVESLGSSSLTPISSTSKRQLLLNGSCDMTLGVDNPTYISEILLNIRPDAIIHLAEQPSAAWSMSNVSRASQTQHENVIGTLHLLWAMKECCPNAHLIKLGTMGEYGTPSCDIPEGRIPEACIEGVNGAWEELLCPMSGLLFPRTAGSFYHLSKVHDTHNIEFACRNWYLRSTDIMQGVVFGLNETEDDTELTRFDYDECFGTVINRFCTQAIIEHSLTVYGAGGQIRGFLPLKDSIQCITIALNNPPSRGEYRTFNQFESTYSVFVLANMVAEAARELDLYPKISKIPNPRKESEHHYYNPAHHELAAFGYVPTTDIRAEIKHLLTKILPYKLNVVHQVLYPKINWR